MTEISKNDNAKDILKQLAPCWIISFALCYMLFIYEPLMMYATNREDFWFDFGIMIAPTLKIFAMLFAASAAVLTGLFFLSKKLSKNVLPYRITVSVLFAAFLALYIQGVVLVKNLPALDGSEIDWGGYAKDDIITLVIWLVLGAGLIFAFIKLDTRSMLVYMAGVSIAVFVMLNVSLVPTAFKNDMVKNKNNFISTAAGFNEASKDRNFFVFLVDSQSASEFTAAISGEEFKGAFDDFTYYPDTTSAYAYTRDSVPYILTGKLNKNEDPFEDYCFRAYNSSELLGAAESRGYSSYLYSNDIAWYGEKSFNIKNNPGLNSAKLDFGEYFTNEMRYVWFKYLPYAFKKYSGIEKLDFGGTVEKYRWGNDTLYNIFNTEPLEKTSGAQLRYIHAEGAHVPLDMDENMNRIKGGTYEQKTVATAKLIKAFLERLKREGVYDNSAIIILADHGYQPAQNKPDNYILSRFNPILLIKGVGEKHEFNISDKPVSYLDLPEAYAQLLDGKQSAELFADIEYPRTRTVIWYEIYKEEHMVEYQTDGKATEWDKFKETGNVFDLAK